MATADLRHARLAKSIQEISVHDHLCAIYDTPEQAREQCAIFVRSGLERGERCVYIAAGEERAAVRAMQALGIEVRKATRDGGLLLVPGHHIASRLGQFTANALIEFWKENLKAAKTSGHSKIRVVDDMKWMLGIGASREQLLQYEAKLNPFLKRNPVLAICLYDRKRFGADMLLNVVRTHPKVVYRWSLCKNPYYVPPQELFQPPDSERELQRLLGYIGAYQRMEGSLHQLSARLLALQDEERRNLARHLHETLGQSLVALKMNLAKASRSKLATRETRIRALLEESLRLADDSMQQIRTVSYLLYPPLLDEAGLLPALRWYAAGFAERSGIAMNLDVPPGLGRLPKEIETAVFRMVQETLTNVHRHAKSATARIRLLRQADNLRLEVEDVGVGMGAAVAAAEQPPIFGVGLAAIRERATQLGGRLEIETSRRGTKVSVILPVPPSNLWKKRGS